ncbi:HalOD1 output domain-containing protein [Natrarchaeobius sp. A-rgal3]|uniref:HalOD1 output domain-containing protein n=1 Tax=Natrarchaeobius versutus TaxID=1679078 RepID=UPI00350F9C2A
MSSSDETSVLTDVRSPSQSIVAAVAAREGVDAVDIEPPEYDPLYTVVDPESLDTLFETRTEPLKTARVSFEYEGYEIVVYGDGRVEATEPSSSRNCASGPSEEHSGC